MFTHFHLSYSINVKQMQNIWLPFCHRRNLGHEQYEMSIPIFGGSTFFIPIKLDLVTQETFIKVYLAIFRQVNHCYFILHIF